MCAKGAHMGIEMEVLGLLAMAVLLFCGLRRLRYRTVRVYNWDGRKFRFLGYLRLKKAKRAQLDLDTGNDTYVINLTERMWDLSYTTRYLLLPSKQFLGKKKNGSLIFQAGQERVWMAMDSRLCRDIYYRLS
jgi:hypothetical protein